MASIISTITNRLIIRLYNIVLILAIILSSCENIEKDFSRPDDLTSYMPEDAISFIYSLSCSNNYVDLDLTVKTYILVDVWQIKMSSVEVYADDVLLSSMKTEPYTYQSGLLLFDKGSHQFVVIAHFDDLTNGRVYTVSKNISFEIKTELSDNPSNGSNLSDVNDVNFSVTKSSTLSRLDIAIDKVNLSTKLVDEGWSIQSVEYYIEDEQIQKVTLEPFGFSYTITNPQNPSYQLLLRIAIINSKTGEEKILEESRDIEYGNKAKFALDYDVYAKDGEEQKAEVKLVDGRYSSDAVIDSVTFYLDGNKLAKVESSPFVITYNIPKDNEWHNLYAKIEYKLNDDKSRSSGFSYQVSSMKDDTHMLSSTVRGAPYFFVDETLICDLKLYVGKNITDIDEAEVYLDDVLIASTTTFPYSFEYKLNKTDIGYHKVAIKSITYDSSGKFKSSQTSYRDILVFE